MIIINIDDMWFFLKVKAKSTMEEIFFDFSKTKDAVSELSTCLVEIEASIKNKSSAIAKERDDTRVALQEKEEKIALLSKVTQEAMDKIDNINKYIAEVL